MILDIGCGNGRDSFFFSSNDYKVIGIDQGINNLIYNDNLTFVNGNLIYDWLSLIESDMCVNIYGRFMLHAISLSDELLLMNHIKNSNIPLCFFEFRTNNDPLKLSGIKISNDEYYTDHYRRFICLNDFIERRKKEGFEIVYAEESDKFAPYKEEKPFIARVILRNIDK